MGVNIHNIIVPKPPSEVRPLVYPFDEYDHRYAYKTILMDDNGVCARYRFEPTIIYNFSDMSVTLVHTIPGTVYKEPYIFYKPTGNAFLEIEFYTPGCYIFRHNTTGTEWAIQVNAARVPGKNLWVRSKDTKPPLTPEAEPTSLFWFSPSNGKTYDNVVDYYYFTTEEGYSWDGYNNESNFRNKLVDVTVEGIYTLKPSNHKKELLPTVTSDNIVFDKARYYKGDIYFGPVSCVGIKVKIGTRKLPEGSSSGYYDEYDYWSYITGYFTVDIISHIQRVGGSQLFCYLNDGSVIPFQKSGKNLYGYGSMQLSGVDYGSYMKVSVDGEDSVVMDYWQKHGIYVPRGGGNG